MAAQPYPRRWQALIVLAVSLLVITVGNTILNVALPSLQEDVGASSSQLQWIVDSYMLVYAGLLLAAGTLGDRFGRRRALISGLTIFGLGSVLACLADSASGLIAARAVMGVGAAGIMPTTLSILTNIFPDDERPKAIGIWAAVSGLGIAIGPVSGGWLIEHMSSNAVFLVNLPTVIACLIGALTLVPESRDPATPKLDVAGAGLSIAGLTSIVWGLIEAPERGWTETWVLVAFAAGVAILAAFVAWERRVEEPMLQMSVFRNRRFSAASASVAFVYFALMGVMYVLTTYLQTVLGCSALEAGEWVLPTAVGMILATRPAVVLSKRIGTKITVAAGLAAVAGAFVMLSGLGVDAGFADIALVLFTMGAGVGLVMSPATEAIMGSVPADKAGIGSAMNDVVREVAGTLGVAVLGSLLASGYGSQMGDGVPEAAKDSVGAAHAVGGADLIATANDAFVHAMSTTAGVAAAIAVAGALIAALFLPARARGTMSIRPVAVRVGGESPSTI
jgi:EmrB/QacA subfamily drug resistance transporter